jgi:hypothetical protein
VNLLRHTLPLSARIERDVVATLVPRELRQPWGEVGGWIDLRSDTGHDPLARKRAWFLAREACALLTGPSCTCVGVMASSSAWPCPGGSQAAAETLGGPLAADVFPLEGRREFVAA